ncbi:MAG: NnrS family protein [Myxococcota bacterium]|nr:NnrS family protein [Myxococcota bacterium]
MRPLIASLQKSPFRLLFPVGGLTLLAGVLPWLTFALGLGGYLSTFHSVVQVQGFLSAFAAGFLFTFIPRRTGKPPPSVVELALGAALPLLLVIAAWTEAWLLTQVLWLLLVGVLARFVLVRVTLPSLDGGLVWVPLSLAMGVCGALLVSVGPRISGGFWLHSAGQALLTQGMFTGLCLGVGRLLFPVMVHGRRHPAETSRAPLYANALAALVLFLSFFLEALVSARAAWSLRAILTGLVVVLGLKALDPPTQPGLHRRALWLGAWGIPLGYATMALFPAHRLAGLHVLFIGGFTLMLVGVSAHLVLSHGGHATLVRGRPLQLRLGLPLLAVALAARVLMSTDPSHLRLWSGLSSLAFLAASAAWLWLIAVGLGPPRPGEAR